MNWKQLRCFLQWWPIGGKERVWCWYERGRIEKDSISSAVLLLWRALKPPDAVINCIRSVGSVTEANTPIYYVYMISVIRSLSEHLTFIVVTKGPLVAPTPRLFWLSDLVLQMCVANIYVFMRLYNYNNMVVWQWQDNADTVECFFGKELWTFLTISLK